MGVPLFGLVLCVQAGVCVCVYFLMFYLRRRLMRDDTSLFHAPGSKHTGRGWSVGGVKLFSWDCTRCWRPHKQHTRTRLCLHKASISSTQIQCLLSKVTVRPWTPAPQHSDHPVGVVSWLYPHVSLSCSLVFFCLSIEKETHVLQRQTCWTQEPFGKVLDAFSGAKGIPIWTAKASTCFSNGSIPRWIY